ncbi:uncharacterized protein LOC128673899 isoform X5 [Plodia interpunctella]|uniref:uncharacterized protein LOC128673899 isoform X5 n=1 Tax=Plodia interpunctella TaxID=58824 RepID=UPI002368BA58|nr:uncharacterized protein LOC128673899 isoform X5 [Plodia interpunctella]
MLIMTEIYGDDDINKVSPFFSNRVHIAAYGMRWRRRQCRVNISYFILLLIFVLSGVLVLTQLLFERSKFPRHRYEELQAWYGRTEFAGADGGEILGSVQYPQDGVWQRVAGTRFKFYVYSAFVERRTVAAVRIIAATKTRGPDPVVCRLWLPDNRTVTLKARVKAIRENWNYRYSATYILCLLSDSGIKPQETAGASVAVLASAWADKPHSNLLTIVDTTPINENKLESLQVCVKPLHSSFARADWLVEWFEFNRLLGASHFYMYNKSTSAPVGCVLNYYRRLGLVTLLPWKLPMQSLVEIRTEGQFAAFNDCLYRSMPHTNWLLVIDVDELVLPRRERTLPALLEDSRAKQHMAMKNPPSGFLFRNAFFYLFWKDDESSRAALVTARKTRRRATPQAVKHRSKYAVRPRDVLELGNHFVWEHAPGALSVGVAPERALLHHYRDACEADDLSCLGMPSTVDRTAHRWTDELTLRVKHVQDDIKLNPC